MGNEVRVALTSVAAALFLGGRATWSTSSVDTGTADRSAVAAVAPTSKKTAEQIEISDRDVVDRKYTSLGDIAVTVNKTTIFNADPTPEMVNQKLREKAAEMGADAVILVRYGKGGVSLMSWGSLEGKGRAVKYLQ